MPCIKSWALLLREVTLGIAIYLCMCLAFNTLSPAAV